MPSNPAPTPPTANKPRRRPAPGLGGNWLWLVLVALLFLLFFKQPFSSSGTLEYGEYYQLLTDPEASKNITKITSENDRVIVEIGDVEKLPKDLQKKVAGNKFAVQRLHGADDYELANCALALRKPNPNQGLDYSDFYRLVMDPEASKSLKRVVYEGPDRLLVEVDDKSKLPEDVLKKLSPENTFTIDRPHYIEDKEVDEALKKLTLRTGKPLKLDEQSALSGAPPVKLEQQTNPYETWGPILLLILVMVALTVGMVVFLLPRFRDPLGGGFLSNYIKSPAKRYERNKTARHLRRRGRHAERQERVAGDRRVPASPGEIPAPGGRGAQGRAAGRPARHRQDAAGPGRRRRGRRAVLQHQRLRIHSDVRRRRRQPGPRHVQDGQGKRPLPPVHRRDRRRRPHARGRRRRRLGRARADAQPDPERDGRLSRRPRR